LERDIGLKACLSVWQYIFKFCVERQDLP